MTAINIVAQPDHRCIHVMTDAAFYTVEDARVLFFGPKTRTIPAWPGIVASRGDWLVAAMIAEMTVVAFETFDALVAGVEEVFRNVDPPIQVAIEFIFAGWSEARNAPEAYLLRTMDTPPPGMTPADVAACVADGGIEPEACRLIRLPNVCMGPMIDHDDIREASGYRGIDKSKSPEAVVADMLLAMEVQRRQPNREGSGYEGAAIGGYASVSTITPSGVTQRVVRRWADQPGTYITPEPADWAALRRGNLVEVAPEGESRLRREMRERRDRKANRR